MWSSDVVDDVLADPLLAARRAGGRRSTGRVKSPNSRSWRGQLVALDLERQLGEPVVDDAHRGQASERRARRSVGVATGTTSTGRSERWSSLCGVEPSSAPLIGCSPWVPTTIARASCSSASVSSASTGRSGTSASVASTPASLGALERRRRHPLAELAHLLAVGGVAPRRARRARSRSATTIRSPVAAASSIASSSAAPRALRAVVADAPAPAPSQSLRRSAR